MALQYADAATKTLIKAVPTLDTDGNVKSWNLKVEYSLNDYTNTFSDNYSEGFEAKSPEAFTKEELFSLVDIDQFDLIYDSQYESVKIVIPAVETVVSDFDLSSLA